MKFTALILLTLMAIVNASAKDKETQLRPNIIFIFADDWGWGDLGCHGHKQFKTPNIDRLAKEGTDFHQFTVAHPVCSPSRVAVMTGHFPAVHSIHRHFASQKHHDESGMPDWLSPEPVMLPRLFSKSGYQTAHFGKWHLSGVWCKDAPPPSEYGYTESGVWYGPGPNIKVTNTDIFDKTIEFIKKNQESPFFINVWLHETHTPHIAKNGYLKQHAHLNSRMQVYAAIISEADHGIGQILKTLDELNLSDNTLIVFSSDNGPEAPSDNVKHKVSNDGKTFGIYHSVGTTGGLKGRKRSLYEGGIRVPFIVRWPGKTPAGKIDNRNVITAVDLLPTFCAAAGIELPADYESDGESRLESILGNDTERSKAIFWEWTGPPAAGWSKNAHLELNWPRLAVRDGNWKLLMNYDRSRIELYNPTIDRSEKNNLLSEYPEVAEKLSKMLLEWKSALPETAASGSYSKLRK